MKGQMMSFSYLATSTALLGALILTACSATPAQEAHGYANKTSVVKTVKPGAPVLITASERPKVEVGGIVELELSLRLHDTLPADRVRVVSWPSAGLERLSGQDPDIAATANNRHLEWSRRLRAVSGSREALNLRAEWLDAEGNLIAVRSFAMPIDVINGASGRPQAVAMTESDRTLVVLPAEERTLPRR